MDAAEIAKGIVIALIEHNRLSETAEVCAAYKQIARTVDSPWDEPTTN